MNISDLRFLRVIWFAVLLVPGLSAAGPPPYYVDESLLPFDPLPGATAYWGVHAGAGYRIEVPDEWNGELVMWAHGYVGAGSVLAVQNHPIRDHLIAQGYAWAASSYRRNDYDVANGVQDTHALMKRFNGLVAMPSKVYITGASMGGHITAVAIEQYPTAFAGALPICGVMADFEQFDFFLDFNISAQQLALGASIYPVDFVSYITSVVPLIKAGLEAVPDGWPLFLNDAGMKQKNLVELRSGGDRPNFDEGWFLWNVYGQFASGPGNFMFDSVLFTTLARSPGQITDNMGVVYQFDADPSLSPDETTFNNDVFRIMADPQARSPNGLAQVPVISGDIGIPVLTIHNLGDLFVPVVHQVEYARRVADNGKSDLLVQRAVRGAGHCDITANEFVTAFTDLVGWVETGAKPAGDNWLDPATVADPTFGCTFTDGFHFFAAPCP